MKRSLYILLIVLTALVLITCKKRPELKIYKLELTEETVSVSPYSATIRANYSYQGEIPQIKVYTSANSSMYDAIETDAVLDNNTLIATIDNLSSDTKYFYYFKYSNGINLINTDIRNFTTEHAVVAPTVVTIPITSVTSSSAISGGTVTDNGGADILEKGVCWSISQNPTIADSHTSDGTGSGAYVSALTDLLPNTLYYVRSYATNSETTGYGNELSFTTSSSLASITTKSITNITPTSASSGGVITDSGGLEITSRGVCWSTEHNPTIDDPHSDDGVGIGEFDSEITGLVSNVTYYVRAYATTSYGTSYGNEVEFTTQMGIPTVTTKSVTGITATSASSGGNVTNSGGGTISARGVCWSTSQNPSISDSHTSDGTGVGEFTSSITGLDNNTTYYVRAYATNSNGTAYGEERSFTTQEGLAVVTTTDITNITASTASSGGNITDDGGYSITSRGVCWSTSQNPTTSDSHTSDGSGMGAYSSSLTSLTYNTTYYVRAYATNSKGTSYGEEKSFTTTKLTPTVTTKEATSITSTTAVAGGNVTSDGGASVTARGICWSTSQNPTISGDHTSDGNGTGEFTSSLTDLTANTTYYIRAYATNSEGTSYGEQKTFTTTQSTSLPEVTTYQVTSIGATTATCGGYVVSDGGSTVTSRGVCWSTEHNPVVNIYYMTNDGSGTGEFSSSITGLSPNTTYYVRAYASNSVGTNYGEEKSFTTNDGLPVVTTAEVSDITQTTAVCGGNVTSDGGLTVTSRGVCWSTSPNPVLNVNYMTSNGSGTGEFTSNITDLSPSTTYYVRAYASNSAGTSYGEQKTFTTQSNTPTWENGVLPGLFSISSTQQVHFSQGNLQYIGSASTPYWKFADNQWDCLGNNGQGSDNPNVDRDLFGWGTSGYNHGAIAYQPYDMNTDYYDYYVYGSSTYSLNNQTGKADWGYNPIMNGSNLENNWRTLTRSEWTYLLFNRNTTSGIRYAKAKVGDMNGIIVLPDNWNSSIYNLVYTNNASVSFSNNTISQSVWRDVLEINGAVFLPCSGGRYYQNTPQSYIGLIGAIGQYWSATNCSSENAYSIYLHEESLDDTYRNRASGCSVRLVYSTTTPSISLPTVSANSPTSMTSSMVVCGGIVTSDGGSPVTSRGVCWSTSQTPTVSDTHTTDGAGIGEFTSVITGFLVNTPYHVRAYATNELGTAYSNEFSFTYTTPQTPIGAINGVFSVSETQHVWFSQGNLQYQASSGTWRFATNQYDCAGDGNANISSSYNGWIDLFGWGTSGINHGAVCYQPWSTSNNDSDYYAYGNATSNLNEQSGKADWGYNIITNGGGTINSWRTLTNDELLYMFNTRNTLSGIRYAKAIVNGVNGVVVLPDNWNSNIYSFANNKQGDASFDSNSISLSEWTNVLEFYGAVFLPASGIRNGTTIQYVGLVGSYWSAICGTYGYPYSLRFVGSGLTAAGDYYGRHYGCSVRLARDVE